MAIFDDDYNVARLAKQPFDPLFLERVANDMKIKNYSATAANGSVFGFPRHGVLESRPIFVNSDAAVRYLNWEYIDSSVAHTGAQVCTFDRPEDLRVWYPAADVVLDGGSNYITNDWQVSHPTRLRVVNDTSIFQTSPGSLRLDYWGVGNMWADCEFASSFIGYRFLLIDILSTIDNLGLQLMLDTPDDIGEEDSTFVKNFAYDILLPQKNKWYTIVWDLSRILAYNLKGFGIKFQHTGRAGSSFSDVPSQLGTANSIYIDRIEAGDYWSDLTGALLPDDSGYYDKVGDADFNSLAKKEYLKYRILFGAANRLSESYISSCIRRVRVFSSAAWSDERTKDLMRYTKYSEGGQIKWPVRNGVRFGGIFK